MKLSELKKIAEERNKAIDLLDEYNKLREAKKKAAEQMRKIKEQFENNIAREAEVRLNIIDLATGQSEETLNIPINNKEVLDILNRRVMRLTEELINFCEKNDIQVD